jgi:cell wall-associated NlpC family hydrolase
MIDIKKLFVHLIVVIAAIALIRCSGSSSSLRYNNDNQTEKSEENTDTRYASQNNSSIDDTSIVFDDEIPEYQDPSDLPEDESKIDLTALMKNLDQKSSGSDADAIISTKREVMLMEIIKYMDTPYKFGGNSLNGIDCSAFTQNVYQSAWMLSINRSAREQYKQGIVIEDRNELEFGDLVFFNTRKRVKPGHVGIYIGDNLFAHASSKNGVTISSLDHDYYNKRYMGARRIEEE